MTLLFRNIFHGKIWKRHSEFIQGPANCIVFGLDIIIILLHIA